MNKFSPFLLILIHSFLMNSGCSMLRLESTWKDRDITLDGKGGDWQGAKYYFEEFAVSVGLINDTRHLYVSMMTENPLIRAQIMRQGLTVWIDPKGGKSKTFGIRFPLGRQEEEQDGERMDPPAVMDEMDREFWNDAYQEDPDHTVVEDFFLGDEVKGLQPGAALDLGCGTGPNALMLAERGWSVVGVDWAEHAIELATQATADRGLDATFVVGDITAWKSPAEFDLVISTYALPGGEDNRRVLQTSLDALAQSGTLIVAEWDRSMAQVWFFEEEDLMTPEAIVALLPGLEIEKAEVKHIENAFPSPDDPRGEAGSAANVAFVRARKP